MRSFLFYVIAIIFLLSACSPRAKISLAENNRRRSKVVDYAPFALIEDATKSMSTKDFIAEIEIKDGGFSTNCEYRTVVALAKSEAQNLGGNCIIIREHKKPNFSSTCHRIKSDVYRIDNPEVYEKEILWHKNRKLQVRDFKGPTANKSHLAVTATSISYNIKRTGVFSKDYIVEAYTHFSCDLSYFKQTDMDRSTLSHEQIHFDITELYARIFLKVIQSEAGNINEALGKSESIMNDIMKQLQIKQKEYDAEVYPDRSKQSVWDAWIVEELKNYDAYASKVITVKAR